MTNRERTLAVLNYEPYDRLPVVHFGFWPETLEKWAGQGHLTAVEAADWRDGNSVEAAISGKLGFDFNWLSAMTPNCFLSPAFEEELIEQTPEGHQKVRDRYGVIVLKKPGTESIPAEIDHTLKTRKDWEEHYVHRLQYSDERVGAAPVRVHDGEIRFGEGGLDFLRRDERDYLCGLHCGSLFGEIRNMIGLMGISYIWADDPDLFAEIIDTVGDLCYRCTKTAQESGAKFDFGYFWEDICYKNGPLLNPRVFDERVGPHYERIADLLKCYGVTIVSVDCDGLIDTLVPLWLKRSVNTMFPIEVGTWGASIAPWREQYGEALRGVGGMNKGVFLLDTVAVDAEIERLKPLIELGGYIPCPDHRIAPEAEWDTVRYYCDRFRDEFS